MNEFKIEKKVVGKKNQFTCLHNGKVIGTRTTTHDYTGCYIVVTNKQKKEESLTGAVAHLADTTDERMMGIRAGYQKQLEDSQKIEKYEDYGVFGWTSNNSGRPDLRNQWYDFVMTAKI